MTFNKKYQLILVLSKQQKFLAFVRYLSYERTERQASAANDGLWWRSPAAWKWGRGRRSISKWLH